MFLNLSYAVLLVFGTAFIHAGFTWFVIRWLHSESASHWALRNYLTRVSVFAALIFLMTFAAYLEAALWAGFYVWIDALPDFGEALYFSLVTFTTLGYGDVTLPVQWRILGATQAANGILLFGWTTALIVAISQRAALKRRSETNDR